MLPRKRLIWTTHVERALIERKLERRWVEDTARDPQWTRSDPDDATVERRFRAIPERQDRILRVAVVENFEEIRIVTAFLDRRARRPQ